jgi:hypothetical protein
MIDTSRKKIRNFGILFGVIATALAGYWLYRGNSTWEWSAAIAGFFWITAYLGTLLLKPLYIGWMTFAFALGWVNTRLLLGVFYYLVLTPIGLVLRLTGKDLLNEKIDREASSYWIKRGEEPADVKRYERMF